MFKDKSPEFVQILRHTIKHVIVVGAIVCRVVFVRFIGTREVLVPITITQHFDCDIGRSEVTRYSL